MENIKIRTIELTEYTTPEGKVFRKIEFFTDENGKELESRIYASKLIGEDIDISSYQIVDVSERDEWEQSQSIDNILKY